MGGYGPGLPDRSTAPGLKSLRLGRELEENMVITLEPGNTCSVRFCSALPVSSGSGDARLMVSSALTDAASPPVTGIYFIPSLLKAAFANKAQSKFLVQKKLQDYFDFGGQQPAHARWCLAAYCGAAAAAAAAVVMSTPSAA